MRNPKKSPSIVYMPSAMNCPLKECGIAGRSTMCYLNEEHKDCRIYHEEYYMKDFLDGFRRNEGNYEK